MGDDDSHFLRWIVYAYVKNVKNTHFNQILRSKSTFGLFSFIVNNDMLSIIVRRQFTKTTRYVYVSQVHASVNNPAIIQRVIPNPATLYQKTHFFNWESYVNRRFD